MSNPLLAIAQLLDHLEIRAYTLHATDSRYYTERNPDATEGSKVVSLHLTIIGRTAFEKVCDAIQVTPKERVMHPGQRAWWAEADTKTRRLLIEGISFQHQDDWEARP